MKTGQSDYHIFFPLKPGETTDDPIATADGKLYAQMLSYIACRNDKDYDGEYGPNHETVICRGP